MVFRKITSLALSLALAVTSVAALPSASALAYMEPPKHHQPKCATTVKRSDVTARISHMSDFVATIEYKGIPLCHGVSAVISFNSYATDGPTWQTSGTQVLVDHQSFTIDKHHTKGTLTVEQPDCYYQTDLYWGSKRFDGIDGPLPKYPHSVFPTNLIAHRNSGIACKPPVEVQQTTEERKSCEAGVETRDVTTTTDYVLVHGQWVKQEPVITYGDWTWTRDLTDAEEAELECEDCVTPEEPTEPEEPTTPVTPGRGGSTPAPVVTPAPTEQMPTELPTTGGAHSSSILATLVLGAMTYIVTRRVLDRS